MSNRRFAWWAGGLLSFVAWLALSNAMAPQAGVAPCVIRWLTGFPCPGCGMTRALLALGRGDWMAALALHPLAPLLVAEAAGLWLAGGRRAAIPLPPARSAMVILLPANGAALLLVWLARAAAGTLPW